MAKITIKLWIARRTNGSFQFWGTEPRWDDERQNFYTHSQQSDRQYSSDSPKFIRSVCSHALLDIVPFVKLLEVGDCQEVEISAEVKV